MTGSGIPEYFILCLLFYLIGSIPSAYLLIKFFTGTDISKEGSGNVGAFNSFEVSKSKTIGIAVLTIDLLKGFIPSFLLFRVINHDISFIFLPIVLIVAGHNFSVWIKFRGGRGLAPSAGIGLAINYWFLLIWCAFFLIFYLPRRNMNVSNISATLLLPISFLFLKPLFLKCDIYLFSNYDVYFSLISAICLLILLKFIKVIQDIFKNLKN